MKQILTAFAVVALLASCQKEISFDVDNNNNNNGGGTNPVGGNNNTSGLLIKTVAVAGSETQTTVYTYDAQKRLETMTITGTSGGLPINSFHKYVRDNAGRIVKVLQKVEVIPGVASDTTVKTYHYPNATTMDFDYSVHVISATMGGVSMGTVDSTVYHYNAGKMISYDQYMSSSLMPSMVLSNSRYDFIYDASNRVTNMKMYSDDSNPGTMELLVEWKYTYGATSINNLYFTNSAAQNFAMHSLPNTTTDHISKMELISNATTPPVNTVITTTYVNGTGNKPVSGTVVTVSPGQPTQTTKYTFFYQ